MKISEIRVKDKKPYRAYYNGGLIWSKYHERTQAVFDYALSNGYTLPTNKIAYDDYIRKIASNGLLEKNDLRHIYSGDGDVNFRLINVVNPGVYNGTAYGGLAWTNEGVKGNGVNGYIDTNFNPALLVEGQKYQLDDASRGIMVSSMPSQRGLIGVYDSMIGSHGNIMQQASSTIQRINSNGNLNEAITVEGLGLTYIARTSVDNVFLVIGNTKYDRTQTATGIPSFNQVILARTDGYGDGGFSLYFMGTALTYDETQLERQFFNEYLVDLGLEPIA